MTSSDSGRDPAWKYVHLGDPKVRNDVTCNFCNKLTKGGIYRAKQHLVGGFRNTKACPKCPPHVREEIKDFMEKKVREKEGVPDFDSVDGHGYGEDEDDENEIDARTISEKFKGKSFVSGSGVEAKKNLVKPKQFGPMDKFAKSTKVAMDQRGDKQRQSTINEAYKQEMNEKAYSSIARWFYDAGLSFNAANYPSFHTMIEAIGQYGIGLKPPSRYELRVPLLRNEVKKTKTLMKGHMEEWAKTGCSIMSDGWKDRRERTLINFLVNSPKGSMFIRSVDASAHIKSGELIFKLLDDMVEEIGETNVVQVITDNASNNVLAGKLLEAKREHLYWTPCAAHCIDLILEDIGKLNVVNRTIKKAIAVNSYIYGRTGLVNMMRQFTSQKELVRPAITRFATAFLTLRCIYQQKNNLRKMFTSEEWNSSKWVKENASTSIVSTILSVSFWRDVTYTILIFGPLVKVLRLVDGERKPPMGYIYEAMDRAKEAIAKSFKENEDKYKDVFKIIDARWNCQLHHPLHAAGHYLNPEYYYSNPKIEEDEEVISGLLKAIERLNPSFEEQDKISNQLDIYRKAGGLLGSNMAIRHRKTKSPAEWWSSYGASTPNLQKFAVKILSLTCSASGCERNWSVFENVSYF